MAEYAIVLGDVEQTAAVNLVSQVSRRSVISEFHIPLRRIPRVHPLDADNLAATRILIAIFVDEDFQIADGEFDDVREIVGDLLEAYRDVGSFFLGALNIVERDAANRDLEQGLHVVRRDLAADFLLMRFQSLEHGRGHRFRRLLVLYLLVNPVFDENLFESLGM